MIDMIRLDDTEELITLLYKKYLLSRKIQQLDDKIARLNLRCKFYGENPNSSFCEGQKEAINMVFHLALRNASLSMECMFRN